MSLFAIISFRCSFRSVLSVADGVRFHFPFSAVFCFAPFSLDRVYVLPNLSKFVQRNGLYSVGPVGVTRLFPVVPSVCLVASVVCTSCSV